jgi:hypothetical protein
MNEITPTETRKNRGRFKPGPDPRRHQFTVEECQRGFLNAITSIITRYPEAVDSSGRHMAFGFLTTKGEQTK